MKKMDFILGYILLAVVAFFYVLIFQLPPAAKIYPIFVNSLLLFLTLIHMLVTLRSTDSGEATGFENLEIRQLLLVLLASGLYVGLIKIIGYLVSTFIYVLSLLMGLKVNKKVSFLVSLGFSLIVYVLFKRFLRVPLPKGFLI